MKSYLLEVAEEYLEDAKEFELSDPRKSFNFLILRQLTFAIYYAVNENDIYLKHLNDAAELKFKCLQKYKTEIFAEEQTEYALISLALGDIDRAKSFLTFETNYKHSHKFDISVNCKLRELLDVSMQIVIPDYDPTKLEIGLFQAMNNLIAGSDVDWSLLKKYWIATKSKRYEFTIFEHVNLLSKALENVQKVI